MGFLQNLAKKAGMRATKRELDGLKVAIREFPASSVGDIFRKTVNLNAVFKTYWLPQPYNAYFSASVMSPREDFQGKEEIRKDAALLLPVLTELGRDSNDTIAKWGIYFWRVVLMTMLHDELYEDGKDLWNMISRIEGDIAGATPDDDDEFTLTNMRPLYYL